ncbi:MAG TPA: TIGR02117 family protein [Allosphingosinicella sp.]|nr:TIGR02117 family protein [Allosphingosinicella sp.]
MGADRSTPPRQRRLLSRPLRLALKAAALLIGLPIFYLLAGALGSIIPANADWKQPEQGIAIFVRTNGVHTWLVLPKVSQGIDWRPLVDPAYLKDPRYGAGDYLAFGFGNRDFYLNTPSWSDLTVQTTLAAAFGRGPGLLHVEHVHDPRAGERQVRLNIRPEEYRKLARRIHGSFVFDESGKPVPLIGRGYGPADVFYEARGSYNMGRTCNEWTGEQLRSAGIRTGLWTPFSQSVMWRLARQPPG